MEMKPCLIYSDKYNFKPSWLNKLHPFDGMKFSKAWGIISSEFKNTINSIWVKPTDIVTDDELLKVHTQDYLSSLEKSSVISKIVELWFVKYIPRKLLHKTLIEPMKLACKGTIVAAEIALRNNQIVMNVGGGYHHAFADHGEGLCFFADAALSIINCRDNKTLSKDDSVLMIDLDAHRGNGFESTTQHDSKVKNFDMYGFQSYPGIHEGDIDEYPYMIPLKAGMSDDVYLNILKKDLVAFLDENSGAKLVYYNAGNDILDLDSLGSLKISYAGVVKRDKFVIEQLIKRGIPTVIMTSGGYSTQSHKLIADLAKIVITSCENT